MAVALAVAVAVTTSAVAVAAVVAAVVGTVTVMATAMAVVTSTTMAMTAVVGHNRVSMTKPGKDRHLGRTMYPCGTLGSARLGGKEATGQIKRDGSKTLRK